jgi:hypothetical protein
MPVPLQFDLVKEIVRHGAQFNPSSAVDPSLSDRLRDAGVALVTTYIEQLSLLDIVRDPVPMFGSRGGMWIGYRLSERGRELARSGEALRRAVGRLTQECPVRS